MLLDPNPATPRPADRAGNVARLVSCLAVTMVVSLVTLRPTLAGDESRPSTAVAQRAGGVSETPAALDQGAPDDYIKLSISVLSTDRRSADQLVARSLPRGSALPNQATLAVTHKNEHYGRWLSELEKSPGLSLFETRDIVSRWNAPIQLEIGGNILLSPTSARAEEDEIPLLEPTFIGWKTQIIPRILPGSGESTRVRLQLVGQMRELIDASSVMRPLRDHAINMAIDVPREEFVVISNRSGDSALILILQPHLLAGPLPPGISVGEETRIRIDPASGSQVAMTGDSKEEAGGEQPDSSKSDTEQSFDLETQLKLLRLEIREAELVHNLSEQEYRMKEQMVQEAEFSAAELLPLRLNVERSRIRRERLEIMLHALERRQERAEATQRHD